MKTPDDWTREYHEFLAVFDAVQDELLRIPGVVSVSVGVKERDGGLTQQMAFRVYVKAKVPEGDLPPEKVVPRTIRGYPTDVVVEGDKVEITGFNDDEDRSNYTTKIGGICIGNDKQLAQGTLGCFAYRVADDKLVILSNYHVLLHGYPTTLAPADIPPLKVQIGQPSYESCCCCGCNGIGVVSNGVYAVLDCAIAEVNERVPYYDRIRRILRNDGTIEQEGMFLGYEDPVPGHKVFKIGMRTGLTRGTIIEGPPTKQDVKIDNDPPFAYFVQKGDSGSALVNTASMKIVGLIKSAELFPNTQVFTGKAFASPIGPVLTAMGITLGGSDELWWTEKSRRDDGVALPTDSPFRPAVERLRSSRIGVHALELVETHRTEILALVNRSRPGKVAWQRLQGPSFAAAFARSAREPEYRIPKSINGVSRRRAFTEMRSMIHHLGSERLRRDTERYDVELLELFLRHNKVHEILAAVEDAGEPVGIA